MTVIATDSPRFSAVVKEEYAPETRFCRDVLTVNEAAAVTYNVGAVLGKVTATGKYKLMDASASDGSQTAAAIVIADANGISHDIAVAANIDTKVLVISRGPVIVSDQLQFAGDAAAGLAAAKAELLALNIEVQPAL